jgi:hypothetical protein
MTGFTARTDEDTPGEVELETNDDGYPLLPDNTMGLQLEAKKKLLRMLMTSVRSLSSPYIYERSLIIVYRILQQVGTYSLGKDI